MTIHSGVYEILNTVNGKRYIGSSVNIYARLNEHKCLLRRGNHHNAHLQNSWNKYVENVFIFSHLLHCDAKNKVMYEQMCMDAMQPEYNKTTNAAAPTLGIKCSDETRIRISLSHADMSGKNNPYFGKRHSPEICAKMSESAKGNTSALGCKHSDEVNRKQSEIHTGKHHTNETKRKMSEAQKTRRRNEVSQRLQNNQNQLIQS